MPNWEGMSDQEQLCIMQLREVVRLVKEAAEAGHINQEEIEEVKATLRDMAP